MTPAGYPRIPHLRWSRGADPGDLILSEKALAECSGRVFTYEEKLDGFNVAFLRNERGGFTPQARSGRTQGDRGGQLGRVRAWAAAHLGSLDTCMEDSSVLYGEWLLRRHTIEYDRLPDWLVVLDLWSPNRGFATVDVRAERCRVAELVPAPVLGIGPWQTEAQLEAWCRRSRYSTGPAEGIILRDPARPEAGPIAKWLAPGFRRRTDEEWGDDQNSLAESA